MRADIPVRNRKMKSALVKEVFNYLEGKMMQAIFGQIESVEEIDFIPFQSFIDAS